VSCLARGTEQQHSTAQHSTAQQITESDQKKIIAGMGARDRIEKINVKLHSCIIADFTSLCDERDLFFCFFRSKIPIFFYREFRNTENSAAICAYESVWK
jgi:hypothetical protein